MITLGERINTQDLTAELAPAHTPPPSPLLLSLNPPSKLGTEPNLRKPLGSGTNKVFPLGTASKHPSIHPALWLFPVTETPRSGAQHRQFQGP